MEKNFMAEKEIEAVKKSEEDALNNIANAQKEADTILKSAKAQGETTHKQEISKFREEMKLRIEESENQIAEEAKTIKEQGKSKAVEIQNEGSTRINEAVSHIISRVVGA